MKPASLGRREVGGDGGLITVAAEAKTRCVVDSVLGLEVEYHSLSLPEHEEDASSQTPRAEIDLPPVVVANDHTDFSRWIVDLNHALHRRGL